MTEQARSTLNSANVYRVKVFGLFYAHNDSMITSFKETSIRYVPGTHCPVTFDGWSCWPTTLASTSAYVPCPFWIEGFDPKSKYLKWTKMRSP